MPAATWCRSAIRTWCRKPWPRWLGVVPTPWRWPGLLGRSALGWDALLADARRDAAQARLAGCRWRMPMRRRRRAPTMPATSAWRHAWARRGWRMRWPPRGVVHDRATLEAVIVRMAGEIHAALCRGRGAAVPDGDERRAAVRGVQLASFALGERAGPGILTTCATRYRGQTTGSGLAWLHRRPRRCAGAGAARRRHPRRGPYPARGQTLVRDQGATEVRVAVLAEKVARPLRRGHLRRPCRRAGADAYVFGYGMDFHEQGRNLPVIYALGE